MAGETIEGAIEGVESRAIEATGLPTSDALAGFRRPGRRRNILIAAGAALLLVGLVVAGKSAAPQKAAEPASDGAAHKPIVRTVFGPTTLATPGAKVRLKVDLNLQWNDPRAKWQMSPGIPTGDKVLLTFRVTDPKTGKPLAGLSPDAGLEAKNVRPLSQPYGSPARPQDSFLVQETFALVGSAGDVGVLESGGHGAHKPGAQLGRKTGASYSGMVKLPGASSEATVDRTNRYIFAAVPDKGQVAVIDTVDRKLVRSVPVGKQPFHLAAEPSGKRIWAANDGDGSVTSISVGSNTTRSVRVGSGHHEMAFSPDGGLLFVTSSRSGTVSIVDTGLARKLADVRVGRSPHGLDYSPATGRLYVANEGSGTVSVLAVKRARAKHLATIQADKGTTQVRIDPTGKVGVASNKQADTITVFNAASNKTLKTVEAGKGPDGIAFLEDFAIVRNQRSPDATFVNLFRPDVAGDIQLGFEPFAAKPAPGTHARISPSATGDELLAPSPANGIVYQVHLHNGRPMAMSQTKVNEGTDFVLSVTNKVQEIAPGTYQRVVRFDQEGSYKLAVGLGARGTADFALTADSTKMIKPWSIKPALPAKPYVAGQPAVLQYKIINKQTGAGEQKVRDGVITVYRFVPGQSIWQSVLKAKHAGNGVYQAKVTFPQAGGFAMTFNSHRLGLTPEDSGQTTVQVVEP